MSTVKLGDVCKIVSGSGFPKRYQGSLGKEYPFLKVSDMNLVGNQTFITIWNNSVDSEQLSKMKAKVYPSGTVIFPKIGAAIATNKKRILTRESAFDNNVMGLVPDENLISYRYLHLWLLGRDLSDWASDSELPSMRKSVVEIEDIELPSLEEQRRIVARLDTAFEKISAAETLTRQNLDNVSALQKSILDKYLSVSDSIHTHRLGAVCDFVRGPFGGTLKKEYFKTEGYAVYEQRHAIYGMGTAVRYFIDEDKFGEMKRFEVRPGDLLMSCSGTIGKISIAPKDVKQGVINQALLKFTPKKDLLNAHYLKYLVESRGFQEAIREHSGGSAIQNVASVKILKEIDIALPSIPAQERVVRRIEDANKALTLLQEKYTHKLSTLGALRSSMLREAFSTTNTV